MLVIGPGGGEDIATALAYGAKAITGVEINGQTIKVVKEIYRDFVNDIYNRKNVEIIHRDGRSFVQSTEKRYDIIQISAVDTGTGLSSGAYVLSENYLYTKEAFCAYLRHLKDDGVILLIRPEKNILRLCSIALAVMRDEGIVHPENNFLIARVVPVPEVEGWWSAALIKKSSFNQKELTDLADSFGKKLFICLEFQWITISLDYSNT